ncbi:MAG: type II toxin-antitoxin system VapC family toxin [Patulibacter sp.]
MRLPTCDETVIVVDASVLVVALGDDGAAGDSARRRLAGASLAAPELIDLEVASVLRRHEQAGSIPRRRAALALADLADLPIERAAHRALLPRCWELRSNLTVYDAAYVALAELLDAPLLTGDQRLARAPGVRCQVELSG